MKFTLGLSYLGSGMSVGAASCCVLPMALMLVGAGGSGLAIFAPVAAAAIYVLAASSVLLLLAWGVACRRGSLRRLIRPLAGSTALTALAWGLFTLEGPINDYLIGLM